MTFTFWGMPQKSSWYKEAASRFAPAYPTLPDSAMTAVHFFRLKLSQYFDKIFVTMKLCNNQYQLSILSVREVCVTSDPLPRALIPQGRLLLCCFLDASRQCEHEMGKHAIKGGRIATCRRAEHFLWCDMHQIHTKSPYNSRKDSIHLEGFYGSILCGMQIFLSSLQI